jgi:CubicO group peptidase (beta-lactamase class C family)
MGTMKSGETALSHVSGDCDPRFDDVRAACEANFADGEEIGSAVCVWIDGVCVLDLWGGHTDETRTNPWQRNTLVNAYSVGKGILAILVATLVEQRAIELDDPVANVWPAFAAGGKSGIRIRELLAHQAGLPAVRERLPDLSMYDWDRMCSALARQAPYWPPGESHGYHVNTYGYLVGEVVRRSTGLAVGKALRHFVTGPAEAEFFWGLPSSEHHRVARVVAPDIQLTSPEQWAMAFPATGDFEHDTMIWHAYFNPSGISGLGSVNTEAWRRAEIPSTNGHTTARGVAALYAAFLAGGPPGGKFAGPGVRAEACAIHADGDDRVLGRPSRFGLGFQLAQPTRPIGPSPGAYGHFGYGGTLGFADPEAGLAFGYVMNASEVRAEGGPDTPRPPGCWACIPDLQSPGRCRVIRWRREPWEQTRTAAAGTTASIYSSSVPVQER